LHSYDLFTLQSRIYNKLLLFAHGIKSNIKSSAELQAILDLPVLKESVTELNKSPTQGVYELRGGEAGFSQKYNS
jgi:hypothetical protein